MNKFWLAVGAVCIALAAVYAKYPGRFVLGGLLAFAYFVLAMLGLSGLNSITRPQRDPARDPDISFEVRVVLSLGIMALALYYWRPFEVNTGYWIAAAFCGSFIGAFCLLAHALSDMMDRMDSEAGAY